MGKKNIEELNLMDDFLMGSVLSYQTDPLLSCQD